VEELGGPATPGVGFAAGVERILLSAGEDGGDETGGVYVALAAPDATRDAFALARRLRETGLRVELEQAGRSLKGQLKQADRIGARATVIVGDSIEVRDMGTGEQTAAAGADEALALVERTLAP
jgi:histidyl-tRNA synthetase